ncbi:hypothetical protein VC83_01920 [Pseudogymnoascus destructans]|uniref:Berberine/berberine-like domain-containing protein n=1 Tax=Pseudogymnoascus destructans TaxID=655981 RepID=A0A177AK73_9PEZI|nr:uncharacterized protein VC83_01920 [Pseudogymnoascus destructans]OAF61691.1 hypothetical protein VC83_01920 [Pseudogymnoascus destructans]
MMSRSCSSSSLWEVRAHTPTVSQFGIVASVVAKYEDAHLDAAASEFVDETLDLLTPKEGKNVYCNISRGGETLEELFGSAERVERLREIKKTWDSANQFKGFASLL